MQTLAEIRTNISSTVRDTQITTLIDDSINLAIQEINDPAWAFEGVSAFRGYEHNWSFNRRKYTLTTVASQEFYNLPRDLDKIGLVRQTASPSKLRYIPDNVFYSRVPDPTSTGNPLCYRLWNEEGVSTSLAANGTISLVSSSTADNSSISVSITGKDTNGIVITEVVALNGTTTATSTNTFVTGYPLQIVKSAQTTGNITFTSGATTLLVMGRDDRAPKFKQIGLYPLPSSGISVYIEYYTRLRRLVNDSDAPNLDDKYIWIIRTGALAKIYQYKGKETESAAMQNMFMTGVRSMVKADMGNEDYVPYLTNHNDNVSSVVELSDNQWGLNF
jgi:hypothetical protein